MKINPHLIRRGDYLIHRYNTYIDSTRYHVFYHLLRVNLFEIIILKNILVKSSNLQNEWMLVEVNACIDRPNAMDLNFILQLYCGEETKFTVGK